MGFREDANELLAAMWLLGVRRRNRQSPTQLLVQMTPPDVFSRRVGQPASAQPASAQSQTPDGLDA